ncbi:MAG TPA: GTP cyclohydrolase II [Allosphingosinicella sp.]|nr:GTP cyclohydrolase II [Allosphingosinicella sp.]
MSAGRPDARNVARAIDALRRGWPVAVDGTLFLAIETADDAALEAFDASAPADILISGNRAVTLKLANQIDGTPTGPVCIERTPWVDLTAATAIADPALDLATPLKGPFRTVPVTPGEGAEAALRLARLAGLLPALFMGGGAEAAATVSAEAVREFAFSSTLRIASRARLPTRFAEKTEIVAFRSDGDAAEHVALLIGGPAGLPPLVRLHSECLTGDVLGSLKCDCGPQLDDALAAIAASGWGILLYLRQEGRGIGLINKLRAYALQDQGFDTVDANIRLGFRDDERDFTVAAAMLEMLSQRQVRLLTNNPRKVEGLEAAGIEVAEQVPLRSGMNPHNEAYLDTKRRRSGHQL